jgi:RHS repeat-associated protein
LTAIGTTTFSYDGFGRRSQNGAGVSFVYDGLNPVQEIVGGSARANLLTGGLDEYFARTDSGGTSSFITDALGSTVALADSTGTVQTQYTFDPFSATTSTGASSTNAFQYTGRENDGSGMYYYRARYYNATLQRFISEDPLGFSGGDWNLYAYVGNDPNDFFDPFGMDKKDKNIAKCMFDNQRDFSLVGISDQIFGTDWADNPIGDFFGGNDVMGTSELISSFLPGSDANGSLGSAIGFSAKVGGAAGYGTPVMVGGPNGVQSLFPRVGRPAQALRRTSLQRLAKPLGAALDLLDGKDIIDLSLTAGLFVHCLR